MSIGPPDHSINNIERLGLFVGVSMTLMMAFVLAAPFFIEVPEPALRLIDQNQTSMWNIYLILVSFLFGTSVGKRLAEQTIHTQAQNIAAAQSALPGHPADTLNIPPDASATVTPTSDGTVIHREDPLP